MTIDAFKGLLNEELKRDALRAEKSREAVALCDKVADCGVLCLLELCPEGEQAAGSAGSEPGDLWDMMERCEVATREG